MKAGLAVSLVLCAAGCEADFPDPAVVTKLRVLAVEVEPPDAAPGDLVTVRPLVADPRGGGREVTIDYALCVGTGADAAPSPLMPDDCARAADDGEILAIGSGPEILLPVPPEIGPALQAAGLESFPVSIRVLVRAGPDRVVALATVLATVAEQRNQNPLLESVTVGGEAVDDGGAVAVAPGDVALAATVAAGSEEDYTVTFAGSGRTEDRTEALRLAWFTTGGKLDPPATSLDDPMTTLEDPFADEDSLGLYLVVTDGRGGVDTWSATLTPQ